MKTTAQLFKFHQSNISLCFFSKKYNVSLQSWKLLLSKAVPGAGAGLLALGAKGTAGSRDIDSFPFKGPTAGPTQSARLCEMHCCRVCCIFLALSRLCVHQNCHRRTCNFIPCLYLHWTIPALPMAAELRADLSSCCAQRGCAARLQALPFLGAWCSRCKWCCVNCQAFSVFCGFGGKVGWGSEADAGAGLLPPLRGSPSPSSLCSGPPPPSLGPGALFCSPLAFYHLLSLCLSLLLGETSLSQASRGRGRVLSLPVV